MRRGICGLACSHAAGEWHTYIVQDHCLRSAVLAQAIHGEPFRGRKANHPQAGI